MDKSDPIMRVVHAAPGAFIVDGSQKYAIAEWVIYGFGQDIEVSPIGATGEPAFWCDLVDGIEIIGGMT
jgi:hypothetical protein